MCEAIEIMKNRSKEQGVAQGEMKKAREMALSLATMGVFVEKIAEAAEVSVKMVQEWIAGGVSLAK